MKIYSLVFFTFFFALNSFAVDQGSSSEMSAIGLRSAPSEKFLNLRIEPHWLVLTEVNLDAQFRVNSHFSVGPTFAYLASGNGIFYGSSISKSFWYKEKSTRPSIGVRGAWYFMGLDRHSHYLAGFAKYSKTSVKREADTLFSEPERSAEFSETSMGVTLGYQWIAGPFTFNAAAGPGYYLHPQSIDLRGADGSSYDYTLGKSSVSFVLDAGMGVRF